MELYIKLSVLGLLSFLSSLNLSGSKSLGTNDYSGAMGYLQKYGFIHPENLNPTSGKLITADTVRDSIKDFQRMANLEQTGTLNNETIEMMKTPRCGVKDRVGYGINARRKKRYALQGSRWRVRDLTYRITKYPTLLTKSETDREVTAAFKVWEKVTDLTFTEATSSKIHIEIRFESSEHGDGDPFDGPGGTLAHAYYPIYGGDAHFDSSESWTIDSSKGTNLFQVAAHEFGHSLGLSHSDVRSALMAPFYRGYQPSFSLDFDDKQAIQALYGTKKAKPSPKPHKPTVTDPSPSSNSLCTSSKFDAIVTMADQKTYVFKGDEYWKLTDDGVEDGFPKKISSFWDFPNNIDAAFTYTNGNTYFFKGDKYWRYTDQTVDPKSPKSISKGFAGVPDNINGAFVWSGNGKIYFFKGSQYYRFDPETRPPVKETYPKMISNWVGIPDDIDDALQYSNGYTYFFKNGKYWRFNDRKFQVDSATPDFPRAAGYWWFGCSQSSAAQVQGLESPPKTVPLDGNSASDVFDADETRLAIGSSVSYHYANSEASSNLQLITTQAVSILVALILAIQ